MPVLATVLLSIVLPRTARADDDESAALLTIEGEAALRDRLWQSILQVTVKPAGEPMEDTSMIPERFGQAVRISRDGKAEIVTAGLLVEGAGTIRVTRSGQPGEGIAKAGSTDEATLLARLECDGPCARIDALDPAPVETWEPSRLLFFVLPGLPDQPVLSHTESLGRQKTPFETMIAVYGIVPPGTVLFDAKGRPVAVTVRSAPSLKNRTLATAMVLPKPEPVEEAAPAPGTAEPETLGAPGRKAPEAPPEKKPEPPKSPKPGSTEPIYYPLPPEPEPPAPRPGSPR